MQLHQQRPKFLSHTAHSSLTTPSDIQSQQRSYPQPISTVSIEANYQSAFRHINIIDTPTSL